jgi:hypothetical protein
MPRYDWDTQRNVWAKKCSCCELVIEGTTDEDESIAIFLKTFSPSNGRADAADKMQSRCWVCNSHRRRQLGITLEWLRDMHQAQEGCCGICGVPISLDRCAPNPANVDHSDTTGEVRQLLCGNCNRGIGLFFHNPELLRAAANYLEFHKESADG